MLPCAKCKTPFAYFAIADAGASDYFLPAKPEFSVSGSELECPNCGHKAVYQRTDLIYKTH